MRTHDYACVHFTRVCFGHARAHRGAHKLINEGTNERETFYFVAAPLPFCLFADTHARTCANPGTRVRLARSAYVCANPSLDAGSVLRTEAQRSPVRPRFRYDNTPFDPRPLRVAHRGAPASGSLALICRGQSFIYPRVLATMAFGCC